MKITKIVVYGVELPYVGGRCYWSKGRMIEKAEGTIVEIHTDEGIRGFGEMTPASPAYLPGYPAGVRTGMGEIVPHVMGLDPRQIDRINTIMDAEMRGHGYVKSAIDMACWDILGKATGLPLYILSGGRYVEAVPRFR